MVSSVSGWPPYYTILEILNTANLSESIKARLMDPLSLHILVELKEQIKFKIMASEYTFNLLCVWSVPIQFQERWFYRIKDLCYL